MEKVKFSNKKYVKNNPKKVVVIKNAVKRGIKEYEETFRRLATT